MTNRLALLGFTSLLALSAGAATAETAATSSEIVVTATRTEKTVEDAPATVTVITARDMDDQLVKNVKDLILFEPGVAVPRSPSRFTAAGSSTGRNGDAGFNIRGLEGNRVLIMVDGVRIPDGYSFGAQAMGRGDYVDLDTLKSVEIVRGPASALYGSDGLAGSVSFITKDPSDVLRKGANFSLQAKESYASSDDSIAESLLAAGKAGRWEGMIAYTRRDGHELETNGTNSSANTDRTVANPEDVKSNAVLGKIVFRPVEGQRFRLTYDHLDADYRWNVLSAIAKPPLTATSVLGLLAHDETQRDRVTLDHRYDSASGWLSSIQTSLYYQNSTTRQFSAEDRNTAADRTRDSTFDNRVWGAAVELQSLWRTGSILNHFVYGADYSLTRQDGIRDGVVPSPGDTFPTRPFPITDYSQAGAYLEDEILAGPLSLYPAVRWDYYKLSPKADALYPIAAAGQSDDHVSPKVSLIYKVNDTLSLFANFAKGFKAPAPSQVNNGFANLTQNYKSVPNPNLQPETSTTYEAGVRLHGAAWSASGTVFTGKYSNFIDQIQVSGAFTPTNPAIFQFVNLRDAQISGAEAKGEVALGHGFTAQAAASYAHGSSTSGGVSTPLATIEPVKLVGGLGWREPAGRFGGQFTAVHSEGKSAARAGVTCTPGCFTPPSFTVLDLTAFWNITPRATLRAGIFNLTDETYYWWSDVRGLSSTSTVIEGYSQPGRNVSVSLAYRF